LIRTATASTEVSDESFVELLPKIGEQLGAKLLLLSSWRGALDKADHSDSGYVRRSASGGPLGDIAIVEGGLLIIALIKHKPEGLLSLIKEERTFRLTFIAKDSSALANFDDLVAKVTVAVERECPDTPPKFITIDPEELSLQQRFDMIKGGGHLAKGQFRNVSISDEDRRAAKALQNSELRGALVGLSQARLVDEATFKKSLPGKAASVMKDLESLGLVGKQTVLECRKTSRRLAVIDGEHVEGLDHLSARTVGDCIRRNGRSRKSSRGRN
jgi:hypothetical protein